VQLVAGLLLSQLVVPAKALQVQGVGREHSDSSKGHDPLATNRLDVRTRISGGRYLVAIAGFLSLASLVLGATPRPYYPLQYEGIEGYRRFVGATSVNEIPAFTFTFQSDPYFDQIIYTVGTHSSLFSFVQTSSGITRQVYHDQMIAAQIDENGAVSRDDGARLKDLVTLEALITGRIAFERPTSQSPRGAHVVVPSGWPVDLTFTPGGRLWRATIHGTEDQEFSPLSYSVVGGFNVVTDWLIGTKSTRPKSVELARGPIVPPSMKGPAWKWRAATSRWGESFQAYQNRPMMPISINGVRAECILDTGSAGLVISRGLATRADVRNVGPALISRSAGQASVSYARADLVAGPAELRSAVVLTGLPSPGGYSVCGYDFLASFIVEIKTQNAAIGERPSTAPVCRNACVRLDTWSKTAISKMRIGSFSVDRGSIDTGADDPLVVDAHLRFTGGEPSTPVDCGSHTYVPRHLAIDGVDVGFVSACYAQIDDSYYQAVVGAGLLARYDLTLDLGDGLLWLQPSPRALHPSKLGQDRSVSRSRHVFKIDRVFEPL